MIDPEFLSYLRQHHRAETILAMVQIEQLIPCWHESISSLALQIGADRDCLNRAMIRLKKLDLIRYYSIPKCGSWVWWIKRHATDAPKPNDEPGWDIQMITSNNISRIPVSKREEWAISRGIPPSTLTGFLLGRQKVLRGKWRVVRSPFDVEDIG